MKKNKLLGGNWKMNSSLKTFDIISEFKESYFIGNDIFLAVPFPYIQTAKELFPEYIKIGAQDCSQFKYGSYTGEVSATMIKEMGAEYVILGHSERRKWLNETSEIIERKIKNALDEELNVVLCIGESFEDREHGKHLEIVKDQIYSLENEINQKDNIDIAYEPVWAIGTGKIPDENQIREMFYNIKSWLKDIKFYGRVVYGGSVSMLNCQNILNIEDVDGFLIGSSSLKMDFCMISTEISTKK